MEMAFTAVFREVPEGYIAFVEELAGASTEGSLEKPDISIWVLQLVSAQSTDVRFPPK